MALPVTLNTNEVKDTAGTSITFERAFVEGSKIVYQKLNQAPNAEHNLTVAYSESGVGLKARARSVTRVDYTHLAADGVTMVTTTAYEVLDSPIGAIANNDGSKMALANLHSFCAGNGTAGLLKCPVILEQT